MTLPGLANPWVLLGALAAIIGAATFGNLRGHAEANKTWSLKIAVLQADADKRVAAFQQQVIFAERKAADFNQQVEKSHVDAQAALDALHAANARVVAISGLYDNARQARRCPGVPAPAGGPGGDPSAAADARLSDAATQFLFAESVRADAAAEYARTCHQWAVGIGAP